MEGAEGVLLRCCADISGAIADCDCIGCTGLMIAAEGWPITFGAG